MPAAGGSRVLTSGLRAVTRDRRIGATQSRPPVVHSYRLPVLMLFIKDARAIPDGAPNIGFRTGDKQLQRFDGQVELAEPKTARSRRTLGANIDNANLMSARVKRKTNDRDGTLVRHEESGH